MKPGGRSGANPVRLKLLYAMTGRTSGPDMARNVDALPTQDVTPTVNAGAVGVVRINV